MALNSALFLFENNMLSRMRIQLKYSCNIETKNCSAISVRKVLFTAEFATEKSSWKQCNGVFFSSSATLFFFLSLVVVVHIALLEHDSRALQMLLFVTHSHNGVRSKSLHKIIENNAKMCRHHFVIIEIPVSQTRLKCRGCTPIIGAGWTSTVSGALHRFYSFKRIQFTFTRNHSILTVEWCWLMEAAYVIMMNKQLCLGDGELSAVVRCFFFPALNLTNVK